MPERPPIPEAPEFFSAQVAQARRFFLELKPKPGKALVVVCGGCELVAADYTIQRRDFPYYSIEFVARGEGKLRLPGKVRALSPGALFTYGPRVPHQIRTHPEARLLKYFVDFAGPGALRLLRQHGLEPGTVTQTSAPGELAALFDDLIRNGLRASRYSPLICAAILEHIVLKIAETTLPSGAGEARAHQTYQHIRRYIEEHYLKLKNLEHLSRECHANAAYLCRLFQRFDHQSPYQYLLRLKMNWAAERLSSPEVLVKQVADELGFNDPFHFSRTFKKVLGLSPEAFRKLR